MPRNKLVVPQAQNAMDQFKQEIASEMGIELGADQTSRNNGKVGGEMVKRLIRIAEQQLSQR
ncbi:alpha/beta-type small acid-soluble spore protein [Aneurinibacillus tyrosinisolvens]|uniref:alpha/beta-type small acid-soluble spore protein n=1 Tax=Aneurinibacillus tyrosinisolvens TaxID=1443435 RepID=UPI00063F1A54|nr:alpha/beta-type small acid-soluble spore protein [Aneurinibacillus tyrosinisolvens]